MDASNTIDIVQENIVQDSPVKQVLEDLKNESPNMLSDSSLINSNEKHIWANKYPVYLDQTTLEDLETPRSNQFKNFQNSLLDQLSTKILMAKNSGKSGISDHSNQIYPSAFESQDV